MVGGEDEGEGSWTSQSNLSLVAAHLQTASSLPPLSDKCVCVCLYCYYYKKKHAGTKNAEAVCSCSLVVDTDTLATSDVGDNRGLYVSDNKGICHE